MKSTGKVYSKRQDIAKGHPENPMSWKELSDKFHSCARYCAKPLSWDSIDGVIGMINELERVKDVGIVMQLLAK